MSKTEPTAGDDVTDRVITVGGKPQRVNPNPVESDATKKKAVDDDEAKKDEPRVSIGELFSFADGCDKALLVTGCITAFLAGGALPAFSEVFGRLVQELANNPDKVEEEVTEVAKVMVYVGLGVFVLTASYIMCFMVSAERQMRRIRVGYFAALLRQNVGWYDAHKPGELTSRLSGDTKVVQQGINDKLGQGIMDLGTFVIGITLGFYRSWRLTLVMLGTLPLMAGAGAAMTIILMKQSKLSRLGFAKASEAATEAFENIRTVQIFGGEDAECTRFGKALEGARTAGIKKGFTTVVGTGFAYFIFLGSYSVAFWFSAYLLENHYNDLADITTCFFSVLMASFSIGMAFPSISSLSEAQGAAHKVFEVLNRIPEIDANAPGKIIEPLQGTIEFKDVNFSYPTRRDQNLFTGLNVRIEAGTTVAFSGASGCGKSSFAGLVQRFYDPVEGSVLIDGVPLTTLGLEWWHNQIGVVSQEPNLFSGSILDNVRIGKPSATQAEVERACKSANIHDTIQQLPDKYNTSVGAVGSQLSGGQKQRLAIARAILRRPKILILDEATSALDRKSEREVQKALNKVMVDEEGNKRTVIVIAHRLTTIRNATCIHHIVRKSEEEGSYIAESGRFEDLMAKEGLFAAMAGAQNRATQRRANSRGSSASGKSDTEGSGDESDEELHESFLKMPDLEAKAKKLEAEKQVPLMRLARMNSGNYWAIALGMLGSLIAGGVYPAYAVVFGKMLEVLATIKPTEVRDESVFWAVMFLMVALGALVGWVLMGFYSVAGEKMTERLRLMLFRNILRQDQTFFDLPGHEAGALNAMLSGDTEAVHLLWGPAIGYKLQMLCNFVVGMGIALYFAWRVALVTMAGVPAMVIAGAAQMMMLEGFDTQTAHGADNIVNECLTNIKTVTAFSIAKASAQRYDALQSDKERVGIRNSVISGIIFGFSQFAFFGVFALAFWYGGTQITAGRETFGDVMIASMAVLMASMGVGEAASFAAKAKDSGACAQKVFALIDLVPSIDSDLKGDTDIGDGADIELIGTQFRYPSRPKAPVLNGIDLVIPNGQSAALVGTTGCGKSTIIQLLSRFYDPQVGHLRVNGKDLSSLDLRAWRASLSAVFQEPCLFSGTVMENIRFGRPDATDAEVMEAARAALIHEEVLKMADGYNTNVGYRGSQLSGGQKQRVAIARGVLRRPKLLLMDEATSALDMATEAAVLKNLKALSATHPMTTITIAHRLTAVEHCNPIALLVDGAVEEEGDHAMLMKKGGEYSIRFTEYMRSIS